MRGFRIMFWFLIITIFSLITLGHLSEASHEHPSAIVVGTVYCDTCFTQDFSKASHFISGASVAVECKEGKSRPSFRKEVKTNQHGEFQVHLPTSVNKHVQKIQGCSVKLIKSSEPNCAVASTATSSSLHLKSRKQGAHIYSAGFFTFKPLTQPNLCNQKPSLENSKEVKSIQGLLPDPTNNPALPSPVQNPAIPSLPPVNPKYIPPLPFVPMLPPLPELPPLPPLPGLLSMPTKSLNTSQQFIFPVPPVFPSPPPAIGPIPLPPNPLQPPALLPPNPLQPPAPPSSNLPPLPTLPPIPTLPPMPTIPPVEGLIPPIPGLIPPIPGLIPPVPGLIPPIPGLIPPVPGLIPPIPGLIPPVPGLIPPIPGLVPPIPPPPATLFPHLPPLPIPPVPGFPGIPPASSSSKKTSP